MPWCMLESHTQEVEARWWPLRSTVGNRVSKNKISCLLYMAIRFVLKTFSMVGCGSVAFNPSPWKAERQMNCFAFKTSLVYIASSRAFKTSLVYIASSRTTRGAQWDLVLKQNCSASQIIRETEARTLRAISPHLGEWLRDRAQVLARAWSNWSLTALMKMQDCTAYMQNTMEAPQKVKPAMMVNPWNPSGLRSRVNLREA